MGIRLFYQESQYMKINVLDIVGDQRISGRMLKSNTEWIYYCVLAEGRYRYKFLINETMLLNDPMASTYEIDANNEIWSVLIIDKNGNKIEKYKNEVKLIDYCLCTSVKEKDLLLSKKIFNSARFDKVVVKFTFSEIQDMHCITVAGMMLMVIYMSILKIKLIPERDRRTYGFGCIYYLI